MRYAILALLLLAALSCKQQQADRFIWPDRALKHEWSAEDRSKDVAVHTFRKSELNSHHLAIVNTREPAHYHDRHELTAHTLRGQGKIHFYKRALPLAPGVTMTIPRGTYHWVENTGSEPLEAYVIFSPPFDGKDRRIVKEN